MELSGASLQTGMTRMKSWVIVILVMLPALFAAYIYWLKPSTISSPDIEHDSALSHALNECDGITEKAALALPPATLEFQKLEHTGRKARVFKLCMNDRGYRENPRWAEYAQPIAQQVANDSQISVDEAMENLRRLDMVRLKPSSDAPAYWEITR